MSSSSHSGQAQSDVTGLIAVIAASPAFCAAVSNCVASSGGALHIVEHVQPVSTTVWFVNHPSGIAKMVTAKTTDGCDMVGFTVTNPNPTLTVLTFLAPRSGSASLHF